MNPKKIPSGQPLLDITVVDISRLLPGGFCSLQLADLGARVIKIEEPGIGDFYRAAHKKALLGEGHFAALNRGKESLTLNLKTEAGKKIFAQLIRRADVIIESFRPGRLEKLGFSCDRMRRLNKRIIVCSITGFGQSGPYAGMAGHDLNYLSLTGLLSLTGTKDKPSIPGFQLADMAGGGLYGAIAILAALREREKTGEGVWIDLSMAEGTLSLVGVHLTGDLWNRETNLQGEGLLNGGAASYQIYPTRDGRHVALAALEPKFWESFKRAAAFKHSSLSGFDPTVLSQTLIKKISGLFRKRTLAQWVRLSKRFDMCLSPVYSFSEVLKMEHFRIRKIFSDIKGPLGKKIPFVRNPLVFHGKRLGARKHVPQIGQHNRSILRQLGYGAASIRNFEKEGVV